MYNRPQNLKSSRPKLRISWLPSFIAKQERLARLPPQPSATVQCPSCTSVSQCPNLEPLTRPLDYSRGSHAYTTSRSHHTSCAVTRTAQAPVYANLWTPQIHPLLDFCSTPLIWDVREPLSSMEIAHSAAGHWSPEALSLPMTSTKPCHIRIISRDIPWSFDICLSRPVTATDALHGIYHILHKPLEDVVWGAADEVKRENMQLARRRRGGLTYNNVDWLGIDVIFEGFLQDDLFAKERLYHNTTEIPETWLVTFKRFGSL